MSEARFTPGPWVVDSFSTREGEFVGVYSDDATGSVVAHVGPFSLVRRPREIVDANARLIAAAPGMYDALRKALNYLENTESELGIKLESADAVRAALSKATGEKL